MRAFRYLLPACLLCTGLAAQSIQDATLAVQGRLSKAESDLKDATDSSLPGIGASLLAEMAFHEGYRARLDIGYDLWQKGDLKHRPGAEGSASAFHVGVEGLLLLDPDAPQGLGPYLLAGIGAYSWSVKEEDGGTTVKRRGTHAAATVGIGYRMSERFDAEVKVLAGRVVKDMNAAAIQLGVTYRFLP